jgi:hypothetical protein
MVCATACQLRRYQISTLKPTSTRLQGCPPATHLLRCVALSATFALRDPLQASIEREERCVAGERRREREGIGNAQRGVSGSELRGERERSTSTTCASIAARNSSTLASVPC